MKLRPYQQGAHDAVMGFVRSSREPCLVEGATGAGKSLIIAELAKSLHGISCGKHVLCLAPSSELVIQNRDKYLATGNLASLYSASAGTKCLRHPVVFATPGTFKPKARMIGERFCAVILDEAHRISPIIINIIEDMKGKNPNLRVIGLSATPYRMGSGYIYRMDEYGRANSDAKAKDPYFTAKVFTITAKELIEQGYLTPPVIGSINGEHYDAKNLELNSRGQFNTSDIDRAFVGHGRKTSAIVNDVVEQSRNRKGVILYAATVAHAYEVLASLPPSLSAIITGETPSKERASILAQFKAQKIKYLVNRDVLTTGFDAPHVDVIALLRATESESLLQQIVGRGMRLSPGKENFLVLDYAENIERHCPDGDLFNPDVKVRGGDSEAGELEVHCPLCSTINSFTARPNPENYELTKDGYFSLHGAIVETEIGDKKYPVPSHFGRRCFGVHRNGERCEYRWSAKECPECGSDNDIAARYCSHCKAELVDPNEKLIADFVAAKKDPERLQTDKVISFIVSDHITQKGEDWKKLTVQTEYRSFRVFMNPKRTEYANVLEVTKDGKTPDTVTYRKESGSAFFKILAFNLPEDLPPNAK